MGKALWAALSVLVVVMGGGAWWLYTSLDRVVATGIRTYGPDITGVSVKLAGVKIQPADGAAALRGLEIGNPKGFKTERALSVEQVSMKLDVASLTKDVVLVHEISIEQPSVTYEYAAGRSNLDAIQRHVEAYIAEQTGSAGQPKSTSPEKKIIIEKLTIKGARAHVSAETLQGKTLTVPLSDMRMVDIGKKTNGVTPAEAAKQVVGALTQNATRAVAPFHLGGAVDGVKKGFSATTNAITGLFK
jgi:hypothetical protein